MKEQTKCVCVVTVLDPDTQLPVDVEIRKTESGIMVGFDGSFLEQFEDDLFSPYDKGVKLVVPDDESQPCLRFDLTERMK